MADETRWGPGMLRGALGAALLAALLLLLAYQLPATHAVAIGGADAAYVQGFADPEPPAADGTTARYTTDQSALLFPQIGLPATLTLRARARPGVTGALVVQLSTGETLGTLPLGPEWAEQTFSVRAGLLKPEDIAITLRTPVGALPDGRVVGALVSSATLRSAGFPVTPYPAQLLLGVLAAALLALLLPSGLGERRRIALAAVAVALPWLLLYRWQPLYPFPLRGLLPFLCLLLGGLLLIRDGAALTRRWPWALDALALGGIALWTAAVLSAARGHLVLSTPGVENDFRVFALRSARLLGQFAPDGVYSAAQDGVLRADGFYNLGYPLLLWLVRPLTQDNPFLAARLLAALFGALLLLASWWLARRLLGQRAALLALAALALSPFVVQYALYLGSDMPFAALCTVALALLAGVTEPQNHLNHKTELVPIARSTVPQFRSSVVLLAGLAAGAAFLIRHPAILLLPLGALVVAWPSTQVSWRSVGLFAIGWLLAVSPQLYVNLRDTGEPLFNQQAKNVWLAVYGDGDWGRWGQTANGISLLRVAAQDPLRFAASWWANLRAYIGTGAEDTSEFGRAIQLRLLGFPANWLAIGGLLWWLWDALRRRATLPRWLLLWAALYVAAVCIGFALPRFFLPLAPLYALALGWLWVQVNQCAQAQPPSEPQASGAPKRAQRAQPPSEPQASVPREQRERPPRAPASVPREQRERPPSERQRAVLRRAPASIALLLLLLLWPGFAVGAAYVLRDRAGDQPGQPAAERAAAELVLRTLAPTDRLVVRGVSTDDGRNLTKYSAIVHLLAEPADAAVPGAYVLQPTALTAPPGLRAVGSAGTYTLYRAG